MGTANEDHLKDNQEFDFIKFKGGIKLADSEEACRITSILV